MANIMKATMNVKDRRSQIIAAQALNPLDFGASQSVQSRANRETLHQAMRNNVSDYNTMVNAAKAVA